MRRNIFFLAILMTLVSCSRHEASSRPFAEATPPSLGAHAVSRTDSQLVVLSASRVTTGALEAQRLSALLGSAKYVGGTERTFVSTSSPLDRVSTRVLQFASPGGAAAYTRWVGAHPADLIGDAKPSGSLHLDGANVYVHTPSGCCPKDIPKSLAVWQRDRYVLEVIASGAYAKDEMLTELSTEMDRLV